MKKIHTPRFPTPSGTSTQVSGKRLAKDIPRANRKFFNQQFDEAFDAAMQYHFEQPDVPDCLHQMADLVARLAANLHTRLNCPGWNGSLADLHSDLGDLAGTLAAISDQLMWPAFTWLNGPTYDLHLAIEKLCNETAPEQWQNPKPQT